jgi:hypothetical protein
MMLQLNFLKISGTSRLSFDTLRVCELLSLESAGDCVAATQLLLCLHASPTNALPMSSQTV